MPQPELLRHLANADAIISRAVEQLERHEVTSGGAPPAKPALLAARDALVKAATWRFTPLGQTVWTILSSAVAAAATWGAAQLAVAIGVAAEWAVITITLVVAAAALGAFVVLDKARQRAVGRWRLRHTPTDVQTPATGADGRASTSRDVMVLCHLALTHIDDAARSHLDGHMYPEATRTGNGLSWLARVDGTFGAIDAAQQNTCLAVLALIEAEPDVAEDSES